MGVDPAKIKRWSIFVKAAYLESQRHPDVPQKLRQYTLDPGMAADDVSCPALVRVSDTVWFPPGRNE